MTGPRDLTSQLSSRPAAPGGSPGQPPGETEAQRRVTAIVGVPDAADPTSSGSEPGQFWTTTNLGEAIPGAQTPLSWTLWSRVTDGAAREGAYRIGGFTRAERASPPLERYRFVRAFEGRAAMNIDYMALLGDRMPGTTGAEAVESVFGRVPEEMSFSPSRRRYPFVAARLPLEFLATPRRLRKLAADHDAWWRGSVGAAGELPEQEQIALFCDAVSRFDRAMVVQVIGIVSVMQPVFTALQQVVERAGAGDLSTLSGASGGAEMAVIADIWAASRGRIELDELTRRHGFHGPLEGELESRVWREDPEPLRRVVSQYAERDESEDPVARDAERRRSHVAAERELLDAVPRSKRPGTRLLLRFARERLPMRGVGKRAFLQALDMLRASSRGLGERLAESGRIEDPDDVFYLTATELVGAPFDARELVAERRERRRTQQRLELPLDWRGMPEPVEASAPANRPAATGAGDVLSGLGVSGGVAEGRARVVTNPDFTEVEPDEILVARATDPSWSSIMFISAGLVMDIGGALSHAAVVARELEIPCVVNTQDGTSRIATGDLVRVDGATGTVEVLARSG